MSDAATGEIRIFASNFAPQGWHLCDGSPLAVNDYQVLFSLIGYTYGGSGTSFNLPDLRGRLPINQGTGTGLTARILGQTGGAETVTLVEGTLPTHTHSFMALNGPATQALPAGAVFANSLNSNNSSLTAAHYLKDLSEVTEPFTLNATAVSSVGGNQSHANVMPCTALNYIICLNGIYPTFN